MIDHMKRLKIPVTAPTLNKNDPINKVPNNMPKDSVHKTIVIDSPSNSESRTIHDSRTARACGSRSKYMPPRCDTLQTHGVCHNKDEICREIRHPLAYYRRKPRTVKKKVP